MLCFPQNRTEPKSRTYTIKWNHLKCYLIRVSVIDLCLAIQSKVSEKIVKLRRGTQSGQVTLLLQFEQIMPCYHVLVGNSYNTA